MTDYVSRQVFGKLIKREEGLAAPVDLYRLAITDDLYELNVMKSELRLQLSKGQISPETYTKTLQLAMTLFDFFEPFLSEDYAITDEEKAAYRRFRDFLMLRRAEFGQTAAEKAAVVYHISRVLLRFAAKRRLTNIFQLSDEKVGG
ncbi:hypothetical protein [Thermococcus sp.]|uniref:hypothetical protein n=1 Tax=Thermococcus sp. TaxID=35749 RepID=UPI0026260775|nr:hypothetical protein [Thermococcus sp.]